MSDDQNCFVQNLRKMYVTDRALFSLIKHSKTIYKYVYINLNKRHNKSYKNCTIKSLEKKTKNVSIINLVTFLRFMLFSIIDVLHKLIYIIIIVTNRFGTTRNRNIGTQTFDIKIGMFLH